MEIVDSRIQSMSRSAGPPQASEHPLGGQARSAVGARTPRCFALVPCAGSGSRVAAGVPKQYTPLRGRAMVAHTLDALARVTRLRSTLVVLARDDDTFERAVPGFAGWVCRCGGATRAESVANGLDELLARGAEADDWALVHDAARCLLRAEWVDRLIDACADHPVGGLLALPVADTLKQGGDGEVIATIDRSDKWAAQTPQMFRIGVLRDALGQAGAGVTDESSAIEALGARPKLVLGEFANFKVTWPGDVALAERLL
jgi:2-C-methyl-D-erythritol 4-phosphate cytidylyltransferase